MLHVANLDRLHRDAPRIGLLVQDALQFTAQRLALGHHLRQFVPADRFPQRGLGAHVDGLAEILDFQNRLLGVPYQPEHDGVHIDRNRVASQRGFRRDVGDAHALVHIAAEGIDDRDNVKKPGPRSPT